MKRCSECSEKHECAEIYEQLGRSKAPSVAVKVVFVFLLPILIFIVSLAIFNDLFETKFAEKKLADILSAVISVAIVFTYVFIAKRFAKK